MSIQHPPSPQFDNIDAVHQWLNSIPAFQQSGMQAANMSLKEITDFCNAMGGQHEKIRTVHVAGTNGKGGTCAILSSVYSNAGYKTGLFTSPHLLNMRERFQINGQKITDEELLAFFTEHGGLFERYNLTYFEITVAIAFWWFHKQNVDIAFIETGLGGRFDATNIVHPLVSVITTVALDHTNYLGDTLEAITREKAGIIKAGVPVVTGNITGEALGVIEKKAREKNAGIFMSQDLSPAYDSEKKHYILQIAGQKQVFRTEVFTPVQRYNLAVAWQVSRILEEILPVSIEEFRQGVQVFSRLLPGRFEKLNSYRQWYFDGAHNDQALHALRESVSTIKNLDETIVIFALMKDKINENVLNQFSGFKKNYYYTLDSQRAATLDDIRQSGFVAEAVPTNRDHLFNLLSSLKSELVIFTGSFYFYSTVKEWLEQFFAHENNSSG
ncbi:MAG: folylpolyglutamate synthase/dihydrofolate synthase family protein [Balneolales bacterium]